MSYNSKYKGAEVESLLDKVNDMGEIPTKVSQLENDVPYATEDVASDGVYAVDASGKLIDYNTADSSCLGVALVAGEHKFMIAKSNATDDTNTTLYWGKNLYKNDVAGITNISSGADYIGEGKKYGTDFTTWSTGPVVDFNGAANTAAIIAGYTEHGVSMDARDMCTVLNTFNVSDSYNDWYIPACGQLALMYLAKTDINAALAKIGGTAFESNYYWSSSESGAYPAWRVNFNDGLVNSSSKNNYCRVRFVRDISTPKPLKERVAELESGKQDKLVSGTNIKTINGESILGSGNIVISGGGSSSGGSGAYAEVSHGTGDTTFALTPNTFHVWDEVASLDLSFADETAGVANEYLFQFTSGATATTLTLPDGLKWANDSAPTIAENMIYQISVLKGLASVLEFNNKIALIDNYGTYSAGTMTSGATLTFEYPVASDLTISLINAKNDFVLLAKGQSSVTVDWYEPVAPEFTSVSPLQDDTYFYIIKI